MREMSAAFKIINIVAEYLERFLTSARTDNWKKADCFATLETIDLSFLYIIAVSCKKHFLRFIFKIAYLTYFFYILRDNNRDLL